MWKLSIIRGLMDMSDFGHIFNLDITDPTAIKEAKKAGKKKFKEVAKEWTCCHSPKIFFEPEIDTSDWLNKKEKENRSNIAREVADAMVP